MPDAGLGGVAKSAWRRSVRFDIWEAPVWFGNEKRPAVRRMKSPEREPDLKVADEGAIPNT